MRRSISIKLTFCILVIFTIIFLSNILSASDITSAGIAANETQANLSVNITTNHAPVLVQQISTIEIYQEKTQTLNLTDYFSDADNNTLTFTTSKPENMTIIVNGSIATIIPDKNFTGIRNLTFSASDGINTTVSNLVKINVTGITANQLKNTLTNQSANASNNNLTILSAKSSKEYKIAIKPREGNAGLPAEWFLKSNLDLEKKDSTRWTWKPLSNYNNTLMVDLSEIKRMNEKNKGKTFLLYSITFNITSFYHNLTFDYLPFFTGECVQMGEEILFQNGESDTTWTFTLNETGIAEQGNYIFGMEKLDNGWIRVNAQNIEQVPLDRKIQIYIMQIFSSPSCINGGHFYLGNITIYT